MECMLTPLCCFAVTRPSSSLSLNILILSGGLLPAVTFGFFIVRFMQSLGSVLIRFLSLLITAAALLGCVCCTKFTAIRNTLYRELSPACQRVRHAPAAAVAHPCELEVPRCRTSQFGRCFLPAHVRMWNDLPSCVFDYGTLSGFKGAVNLSMLH